LYLRERPLHRRHEQLRSSSRHFVCLRRGQRQRYHKEAVGWVRPDSPKAASWSGHDSTYAKHADPGSAHLGELCCLQNSVSQKKTGLSSGAVAGYVNASPVHDTHFLNTAVATTAAAAAISTIVTVGRSFATAVAIPTVDFAATGALTVVDAQPPHSFVASMVAWLGMFTEHVCSPTSG